MKITISKSELIKGTTIVSKAVPSKTVMPILECILLSAHGDELVMCANDMEMAITTRVECIVDEEGEIAVEAALLHEIAKKLPDGDVLIAQTSQKAVLTAEDFKLELPIADYTQFPNMPSVDKGRSFEIPQNILKTMITQTIFARSDEEKNEVISGLNLKVKNGKVRITGLDRKRIATRVCDIADDDMAEDTILPGKTMNEIRKILSDDESNANISISDSLVMFSFGKTVLTSRIIAGEYMDIDAFLEKANSITKAVIDKSSLYECLDRSMLLEKVEDMKPVIFAINNEKINLSIKTARGAINETISAIVEGEDFMIGFDPRVFLDMLKVYDEEEVILEFNGNNQPCFVYSKDGKFTYLALPITI